MFYVDNPGSKENFIIRLSHSAKNIFPDPIELFVVLQAKLIPEDIGFPELLLSQQNQLSKSLRNYSIARYKNGRLIYQHGTHKYKTIADMGTYNASPVITSSSGDHHLAYPIDEQNLIIISSRNRTLMDNVTAFSFLFAFFSLILLSVLVVRNISKGINFRQLSFHNRIQLLMVSVMLISMFLFGSGTTFYIQQQYQEKNHKLISEKIQSVLIEVGVKLDAEKELSPELDSYMLHILTKFSNVFFTDINLYDAAGSLLSTSRPQLFKEGLISGKMDPTAYAQMNLHCSSEFVHEEKIGKLNYLSAYVPFKNKEGKLLAWLNLPYFARQSELENEISSFLVALINIYVFLFALSLVAALLISNFMTEPLRMISHMLGNIELGKANKPIEYSGKDEIGSLVAIYNKKVEELQHSAGLLAKSERETAWREMAKQVAHEIKNPLTPMKLSVQHLERSWKNNSPGWEKQLERFSKTLIEQIDTLSNIAGEFSSFAKMPKAQNERLNIEEILQSCINLYHSAPSTGIQLHSGLNEPVYIFADHDQCLRLFGNLIKNALQAIPDDREGRINIITRKQGEQVLVAIEDNGTGIQKEEVNKIFAPNFTTRSSGTGLGLAIVKNITELAGGKVWFETKENTGTTFFVTLPVVKSPKI